MSPITSEVERTPADSSSTLTDMATDRDKVKSGQVDDEEVQLQPLPAPPVHEPASDEIAEKEEGDLESGKKAPSVEMIDGRPRDIYDRFTKRQKTMITCIVSYSAFIARESSISVSQNLEPEPDP